MDSVVNMLRTLVLAGLALTATVALVAVVWLGVIVMLGQYRRKRFSHIPGPKPHFLVGTVDISRKKTLTQMYDELAKEHGQIFMSWLGNNPVVVVADAEGIREVSIKKFRQFHDRPQIGGPGSIKRRAADAKSMLAAKGATWATLRAAATPVFHTASLTQYASFMNDAATVLLDSLDQRAATGEAFCLDALLGRLTMRVVFKCAFGVDAPVQEDGASHPVVTAAKELFIMTPRGTIWLLLTLMSPGFLRPVLQYFGYWFGGGARIERARDVLYSATNQLAQQYSEAHGLPEFKADAGVMERGADFQVLPKTAIPSEHSLLAALLRARTKDTKEPLESDAILQQGILLIAAGYETTAMTIAFTAYLLSQNPEAEAKLLAEIDSKGRDTVPTYETLDEWPYAKACLKESLRVYPVAPLLMREAQEDTEIMGYAIPKGTTVHMDTWVGHRDPKNFPNPEAYQPERFVDPTIEHPAFLAFGCGPHNCIAYRFALEEATIVLIRMYQRFIFRTDEAMHPKGEVKLKMGLTISPVEGMWGKVIAR